MQAYRQSLIETFNCTTKDPILRFWGDCRYLSNFYVCDILFEGLKYKSSEHIFMSRKTLDLEQREHIRNLSTPGQAKQYASLSSGNIVLRPDWEDVKVDIMYQAVYAKFSQNTMLKELLLFTGDRYLEEGNTWNDIVWGVCNEKGKNLLGQILMLVRAQLRDEQNGSDSNS